MALVGLLIVTRPDESHFFHLLRFARRNVNLILGFLHFSHVLWLSYYELARFCHLSNCSFKLRDVFISHQVLLDISL